MLGWINGHYSGTQRKTEASAPVFQIGVGPYYFSHIICIIELDSRTTSWRQTVCGGSSTSPRASSGATQGNGLAVNSSRANQSTLNRRSLRSIRSRSGDSNRTATRSSSSKTQVRISIKSRRTCFRNSNIVGRTPTRYFSDTNTNLTLCCVILIGRQSNSSQNTDDGHNDHQFDQGKTLLNTLHLNLL